ncbi:MAG: tRNA (N(6)-L-threonylcarbamoyladenosine(37)-C(2))-methylthiotransferase MtaB [Bacteroidetes bacterium]|nr:tRNA (N(6)-L-threonylcarbamoyladenosine(37)-C(2))-methylthiotransferase MtaB [Bacteroidota bacterium]MDA0875022.1 tRNA (N(6)-L-threonylcarbamoyladenosine(37)-C(2))-methylthiotransferase MtaB [Bacteroidota bacterium]
MSTVAFHTLGCKLNFAETGTMAEQFRQRDFAAVPFGEAADVVVLNTCTVTDEADRKCRQAIRKALRANPEAFVIVTGCFAQLRPEEVAGIDGVDLVLGANEKFNLFAYLDALDKQEQTQIEVSCIDDVTAFGAAYSASERTRAFLKVQDGCDYTCSFCTIPQARGRSRSDTIPGVVRQAEAIAEAGYREIVLSGVNIGLFGQERGEELLDLLRELDRVEGIDRFRISSCEPNLLTDDIVDFVAGSRAFMPHFHLPLQSGDDFVLGKMRRRYRRDLYSERVDQIMRLLPDAAIGVDVIVGFPAETPERFENTFTFLADLPISYLHVFTYSERPDTVAVDQLDRMGGGVVPKQERSQRNRRLRLLSEKKRAAFYTRFLGSERPVLWEDMDRDGWMSGFTDNHVRVEAPFDASRVGQIESVSLDVLSDTGNVRSAEMQLLPVV